MGTTKEAPQIQESEDTGMEVKRTVAAPEEASKISDPGVPETDKATIRVVERSETKGKGKERGAFDERDDVGSEKIGMDIESLQVTSDSDDSSSQGTDADEVNLVPSQTDQMEPEQSNDAESVNSRKSNEGDEEDQGTDEEDILILRDPVRVRRYDYMARDIAAFLLNYPNRDDDPDCTVNARFYRNEIRFRPYGIRIDDFHEQAFRRFKLLEQHHG